MLLLNLSNLLVRYRHWAIGGLALFAIALPWIMGLYYISLTEDILIYAIFAMSLNLLLGYTGLSSFGHAAFLGIGAYTLAFFSTYFGVSNLLITLPLVLIITGVIATLIGLFAMRTTGVYFLMVTLAFAQMLFSLAISLSAITGGSDGLPNVPRPSIGLGIADEGLSYVFRSRTSFYYLVLFFFAITAWGIYHLINSPFGWVLRGIRENETRMQAIGYDIRRYKMQIFVIAGIIAGVAGLLLAHSTQIASPENLYWTTSGQVMIMIIVGGAGTFSGPILGAVLVRLLRNFVSGYTERWETLMGIVFIAFVLFASQGLAGLFSIQQPNPQLNSLKSVGEQTTST